VIEHAVFVPARDRVLGAVVTAPDRAPRGLVVLTTGGGGALRSHHFALWTRVARELAERGIASIRMEHAGVGDSTGVARMDFRALPVDDVETVARFGLEATGTEHLGLCGNCGGARAALQAARSLEESETLLLLWMKPLASTRRTATPAYRMAIAIVRRLPGPLKRIVERLYWKTQSGRGHGGPIVSALSEVGRTADIMLLETNSALAGDVPRFVVDLRRSGTGRRIELQGVDGTSLQAFRDLDSQRRLVDTIVRWFDETLPLASDDTVAAASGAGRRP
jgi:alpha/beta superfamily hydrolase